MRHQTKKFVKMFLDKYPKKYKILEVGSMNVSGHLKEELEGYGYIGIDMRDGDNVDVVMNGHDLADHYGEDFDLVLCFDTMEHDDKFWLTIEAMKKVLKPGGWMLIGAPGPNCPKHDHPNDYWRFSAEGFKALMEDMEDVYVEEQTDNPNHSLHDEVYGWGRKP